MLTMSKNPTTPEVCSCCGAKMLVHRHRISKGLAVALIKFRQKIIEFGRNKIHIKDEIALTKSEFNNFQKLRYHGLVTKYINPETKQNEAGYWILTRRGNQFCKCQIEIPEWVATFRNKIHSKSDVKTFINEIDEVNLPYWDEKDDFKLEFYELEENTIIDQDGQCSIDFDL